jgi:hypothetical protein
MTWNFNLKKYIIWFLGNKWLLNQNNIGTLREKLTQFTKATFEKVIIKNCPQNMFGGFCFHLETDTQRIQKI